MTQIIKGKCIKFYVSVMCHKLTPCLSARKVDIKLPEPGNLNHKQKISGYI